MSLVLDHLVILASDLERSRAWYDALFAAIGLEKTGDHVWMSANACAIDLRQAGDASQGYERYAPGLNHLGFTADRREDVDAIAVQMQDVGFDVSAGQTFPDAYAIFFKDPDGMRVEVTAYLSASTGGAGTGSAGG